MDPKSITFYSYASYGSPLVDNMSDPTTDHEDSYGSMAE